MKAIGTAYWASLALAAVVCSYFFLSWNDYTDVVPPAFNSRPSAWYVDSCVLTKNYMVLNGWMFLDGDPSSRVKIHAKKGTKEAWVEVRYAINIRQDVSAAYNKLEVYDRSGFTATIRNLRLLGGLSGDLKMTMTGGSGQVFGVDYECQ